MDAATAAARIADLEERVRILSRAASAAAAAPSVLRLGDVAPNFDARVHGLSLDDPLLASCRLDASLHYGVGASGSAAIRADETQREDLRAVC